MSLAGSVMPLTDDREANALYFDRCLRGRLDRHILPVLFVAYLICFLDRVNIGFVAVPLGRDLRLGPTSFGLGAGLFFVGYFLLEVPSNLLLVRVGVRRWLTWIILSWGLVACLSGAIWSPASFYVVRIALGIAEAGFTPAVLVLIVSWYPAPWRARAFATLCSATAVALVLSAPLSAAILKLDGVAGLAGWRWLLMLEGLPAIILGLLLPYVLTESPNDAGWLTTAQKERLAGMAVPSASSTSTSLGWPPLRDSRLWVLCAVYLLLCIGFYGATFWLPQVVGLLTQASSSGTALVSAMIFAAAGTAMILVARWSDHTGRVRAIVVAGAMLAGLGFSAAALLEPWPCLALASVALGAVGLWSAVGVFWQLPATTLQEQARAVGLAGVNACGSLGGFIGSLAVGALRETYQSFAPALCFLAGSMVLGACVAAWAGPDTEAPR